MVDLSHLSQLSKQLRLFSIRELNARKVVFVLSFFLFFFSELRKRYLGHCVYVFVMLSRVLEDQGRASSKQKKERR